MTDLNIFFELLAIIIGIVLGVWIVLTSILFHSIIIVALFKDSKLFRELKMAISRAIFTSGTL